MSDVGMSWAWCGQQAAWEQQHLGRHRSLPTAQPLPFLTLGGSWLQPSQSPPTVLAVCASWGKAGAQQRGLPP